MKYLVFLAMIAIGGCSATGSARVGNELGGCDYGALAKVGANEVIADAEGRCWGRVPIPGAALGVLVGFKGTVFGCVMNPDETDKEAFDRCLLDLVKP